MVMTGSASVGLLALFLVDFVDMFYLSLLGEVELAAAIGFAGSVLFFTTSISIGFAIATGALASRAIGADDTLQAKKYVAHAAVTTFAISVPITVVMMWFAGDILSMIGAQGRAHDLALSYLYITLPSFPLMALGMGAGGVLRALGDAKGAMWLTLWGGIVNFILDPIFIFLLDMGVQGAALATSAARVAMMVYGIRKVVVENGLITRFHWQEYKDDFRDILNIAFPAVLTNISTPIAMAYITAAMAKFGDDAVAGNAIVSRIVPVAFAGLFAVSGVVGPIAGQNWGAGNFDRVRRVLVESSWLVAIYVALVSLILLLTNGLLVELFSATGEAAHLVYLFTWGISLTYIFHGLTFNTNALFNNLGKPQWATAFNLGKATLGTIPFAWLGSELWGAPGVLIGQGVGAVLTGILGYWFANRLINQLSAEPTKLVVEH